ncbi:MAG: hypothetical protein ACRCTX_07115, partial [Afipia sp.]
FDETFDPAFFAYRVDLVAYRADLDFFAATRCFLNLERTTGRLAEVTFAAFSVLVVVLADDLAAIAGSPEKLIQIPAAATSAANPALLIRMAISPFAKASSKGNRPVRNGHRTAEKGNLVIFCPKKDPGEVGRLRPR